MVDTADAAFLRTILSVPDEDTPRLVYADYLEENDQSERAEFIRLQCELAKTPSFSPRHAPLKAREQELKTRFQVEWKYQLPILRGVHWEEFDRGFVSNVRIDDPHLFFAHAAEIFDAAPIQRLSLHGVNVPEARRLAEISSLSRVRIVDLNDGNDIRNAGLEALAGSPHLRQLRVLKLRDNGIGPAGIRALAGSPIAANLTWLDLDSNEIFNEGIQLLAESAKLANIRVLSLEWTRAGTDGAIALADSPYLTKVHSLFLTQNDIGEEGAVALAGTTDHAKLQALYLANNRIGNIGAIALASSPRLDHHVRWLYLRNNRIGDPGALALAQSPHLGDVKELSLGDNPITDAVGQVLRARFGNRVWLL